MRKVLWSGSLKHQGASLTAPQPPSSVSNPRAKCPNQGRAACAASFTNLPTGGSTDGVVCSIGQHAAWGESWREHMPCLAWDATDIPQEEHSVALSR